MSGPNPHRLSQPPRSHALEPSSSNSSRFRRAPPPIPSIAGTKRSLSSFISPQGSTHNPISIDSDSETNMASSAPTKKRKDNKARPIAIPPPIKPPVTSMQLNNCGYASNSLIDLQEDVDTSRLQEENLIDLEEYEDVKWQKPQEEEEDLIDLEGANVNVQNPQEEEDLIDLEGFDDAGVGLQNPQEEEDLIDLEGYVDDVDIKLQKLQEAQVPKIIDLTESDDCDSSDQHKGLYFIGAYESTVEVDRDYSSVLDLEEVVVLVRDFDDLFDFNTIQVFDATEKFVGCLPEDQAAILSPRMDNNEITLHVYVSDNTDPHKLKVYVNIFCIYEDEVAQDNVILKLSHEGIDFIEASLEFINEKRQGRLDNQGAQTANDEAAEDIAGLQPADDDVVEYVPNPQTADNKVQNVPDLQIVAERKANGTVEERSTLRAAQTIESQILTTNIEPCFEGELRFSTYDRDSMEAYKRAKLLLGEEGLKNLPTTTQPASLSSQLLPYQLQGFRWLLEHEHPKLPRNKEIIQFWKRDPQDPKKYRNIVTGKSHDQPSLMRGGILADDMGLGKTLQMISLILAKNERSGAATSTESGTLVIAPVSVMSNWEQQIQTHIKPDCALKVHRLHGTKKGNQIDLNTFDVVVTSYGTLSSEYDFVTGKKKGESLLFKKKWHRIILDEGHQIRNPKAKVSIAAKSISARNKWVLTGTPIINGLKDLDSIVEFLGLHRGQGTRDKFSSHFWSDREENCSLQILMADLCLRRRKDMKFINLNIPDIKEYIHKVKFTEEERGRYQVLEAEAISLLRRYERIRNGGNSHRQRSDKEGEMDSAHRILERLLRLRQMCNHPQLCGKARVEEIEARLDEIADNGMSAERKEFLRSMLQIAIDSQEDCPMCLNVLEDARITKCRHAFCLGCISKAIETEKRCPICGSELANTSTAFLVEPSPEWDNIDGDLQLPEALEDSTPLTATSSKLSQLITILKATHSKDAATKTVVFSQWTKFLDLAAPYVKLAGFRFCRIDGTMSVRSRDQAIARLSLPKTHPDGVDVMLASLGVAGVGLNLVAANQVILSDTWWAPAIEDQAVDRVHRLGQKRETTVWRLVVENSIEQRVLEVQKGKRKLASDAFCEDQDSNGGAGQSRKRRRGEEKETRMDTLATLLGVAPKSRT